MNWSLYIGVLLSLLACTACSEKGGKSNETSIEGLWVLTSEETVGAKSTVVKANGQGFINMHEEAGFDIDKATVINIAAEKIIEIEFYAYFERALDLLLKSERSHVKGTVEFCKKTKMSRQGFKISIITTVKDDKSCVMYQSRTQTFQAVKTGSQLEVRGESRGRPQLRRYKRLSLMPETQGLNLVSISQRSREKSLAHGVHKYINRGFEFMQNDYYHIPVNFDGSICDSGIQKWAERSLEERCARLKDDKANNNCGTELRQSAFNKYCI